ncbi:uncharacterized protein METZ01_LOCUS348959, partial [marine metagenome]
ASNLKPASLAETASRYLLVRETQNLLTADPQADQVEVKAAGGGIRWASMPRAHGGHARGVVCLQGLETQHN